MKMKLITTISKSQLVVTYLISQTGGPVVQDKSNLGEFEQDALKVKRTETARQEDSWFTVLSSR